MNDVQEQLDTLLNYWIKHNNEHEEEFREWADKAAALSGDIAQQLREAATKMAAASSNLIEAKQVLTKSKEGHQDVSS